jgi:hypothetical protein
MIAHVIVALASALPALAPAAQKPKNPTVCPWCQNDPASMAAAGVVSHGPLGIGPKGSRAIADAFPEHEWVFLETAHLRWASALGPAVVEAEDKKKVLVELDRLRLVLPLVPKEAKKLDAHLRLHLFAMKGEELYARFQKLLAVTDADFPEQRGERFMGIGRYLGEKDKFEVVIHGSRDAHELFTQSFTGVSVTGTQQWHFRDMHKLILSVQAGVPDLKKDRWLWPHVVHNLSHAFLSAYKHFSYDAPCWLDEGLAHALEKEAEPESTTHDGEEGVSFTGKGPRDWAAGARKLAQSGKAPTLAQLLHVQSIGKLDVDANVVCCSMVRFLIEKHPEGFARFLGGIKGQLDEAGSPSGADMPGLQRRLLKECFDLSTSQFDEAWKSWLDL